MHLLGRSLQLVLNPGTPRAKTILNVPNYNFDYQKAYNLSAPVPMRAGDRVEVSCTYDPTLAQELPSSCARLRPTSSRGVMDPQTRCAPVWRGTRRPRRTPTSPFEYGPA